jgi:hypothetical protein
MMKTSEKVYKMGDRSLTISLEISVKETIKKSIAANCQDLRMQPQ